MSFNQLGLIAPLLKAIEEKGYVTPSTIQEKAIPQVLAGKDVLASAQTGTGKTAGFTLPILQLLAAKPVQAKRPVKALILTPTRELAAQIFENIKEYGKFLSIRSVVIFGGVSQKPQVDLIRGGVDIMVATPGRLLDLMNQKLVNLNQLEIIVLDEADRMLDMGFIKDIQKIMSQVPEKRQTLLFSATFNKDIKKMANTYLKNPISVEATPENTTVEKIAQKVFKVEKNKKTPLVIQLIKNGAWQQVLIFTRTKHGANKLCEKIEKSGITAAAIHGNKAQNARVKALADFKANKIRVLVATDIAARGLDIPLLPHVINFELPNIPEDYVHRIGRTGRAGASGEALSLVSSDEYEFLQSIEKLIGTKIKVDHINNLETIIEEKPEAPYVRKVESKKEHVLRKPKPNRFAKPENKRNTSEQKPNTSIAKEGDKKRRPNKPFNANYSKDTVKKPTLDDANWLKKLKQNNGDKEPLKW